MRQLSTDEWQDLTIAVGFTVVMFAIGAGTVAEILEKHQPWWYLALASAMSVGVLALVAGDFWLDFLATVRARRGAAGEVWDQRNAAIVQLTGGDHRATTVLEQIRADAREQQQRATRRAWLFAAAGAVMGVGLDRC